MARQVADMPATSSPHPNAFPKRCRLRLRRDFDCVFRRKCSVANGRLVIYLNRNDLGVTRLGLSVGRRFGNAVRRNRVKRLLREAFRLTRAELATGVDLICIPRVGSMATRDEYMQSLRKLVRSGTDKLTGRQRRDRPRSGARRNRDRPLG